MNIPPFRFPPALAAVVSRLPAQPPSFVFAHMLGVVLRQLLKRGDLTPLQGKHIAVRVSDLGLRLHFTVTESGFRVVPESSRCDLAFTACAHDFYLLASRQEDPDALFFSRRLLVEGDTALGLTAKNALDGFDFRQAMPAMLAPEYWFS